MDKETALKYKEIAIKLHEYAEKMLIETFPERYGYKDLVNLNLSIYSLFNHCLLSMEDLLKDAHGINVNEASAEYEE